MSRVLASLCVVVCLAVYANGTRIHANDPVVQWGDGGRVLTDSTKLGVVAFSWEGVTAKFSVQVQRTTATSILHIYATRLVSGMPHFCKLPKLPSSADVTCQGATTSFIHIQSNFGAGAAPALAYVVVDGALVGNITILPGVSKSYQLVAGLAIETSHTIEFRYASDPISLTWPLIDGPPTRAHTVLWFDALGSDITVAKFLPAPAQRTRKLQVGGGNTVGNVLLEHMRENAASKI